MRDKKYYSINETTKILNIQAHQLRYLEKTIHNFTVNKVMGRRHYTKSDIELLKSRIKTKANSFSPNFKTSLDVTEIDNLIIKFRNVYLNLKSALVK